MTLVLGFAAVNTGNNLLYLLVSALLGFMAASGLLGRSNLAGLRIAVEMPDEIYDGLPTLATIRLENRKRMPTFLVRVELPGAAALFTTIGGGQAASEVVSLSFSGRGERRLETPRVLSAFPVNFFVRWFPLACDRRITVFPAPRPCSPSFPDDSGVHGGESSHHVRGYDGEVDRVSDYRGEPLKLVHWKLTARQDELMVRQMAAGVREPIVLDPLRLPGAGLEERLGSASYLVNRLQREGRPVGLRLGGRTVAPAVSRAHRLRLLTELARHDPG